MHRSRHCAIATTPSMRCICPRALLHHRRSERAATITELASAGRDMGHHHPECAGFHDGDLSQVDAFSAGFVARALPFVAPLYRYYFRCELRGLDRLGGPGAFIVANHNGMGIVEVPLLIYGWYTHFGFSRPGRGLTHNWLFKMPLTRTLLPKVGCVPATPGIAQRTLRARTDLLVFPGGDTEA